MSCSGRRRGSPGRPAARRIFAVSGNVEFARRNYDSLLDAAAALAGEDAEFVVRIVGRSTSGDGKAFREAVESRGLASRFEFSPGEITHPRFFRLIADSDFSLPLIDTSRDAYRAYLETKLASSVPFAIGLGVPLVANAALVRAYGIDGTGPAYEDGGLTAAMRRAIASTDEERSGWRDALVAKRAGILDASLANLRAAIAAVRAEGAVASRPRHAALAAALAGSDPLRDDLAIPGDGLVELALEVEPVGGVGGRVRPQPPPGVVVAQDRGGRLAHARRVARRHEHAGRVIRASAAPLHAPGAPSRLRTCSGIPPTAVATTGRPVASASRIVVGKFSAFAAWR